MFGEKKRLRAQVANLIEKLEVEHQRSFRYCLQISTLDEQMRERAETIADLRVQLAAALGRIGQVRAAVADVPLVNTEDASCRG